VNLSTFLEEAMPFVRTTFVVSFALIALVLGASPAHAQKLITQAKVNTGNFTPGDAPGFPLTISVRGAYKLTGNLVVSNANTTAIEILADNVTLDLNGFGIFGPGGVGSGGGHGVVATQSNITVMNGSVRGVGGVGIYLAGNTHRVENVYVTSTGYSGIGIGGNSIVRGSTVILSNASGVSLAAIVTLGGAVGASITNNVVSSNTNAGVYASAGSTVTGNTVRGNSGVGLWLENGAAYGNNVLSGNASGGAQVSGGIQMGSNVCNTSLC
jgi:parallel beta-helix repeat protein